MPPSVVRTTTSMLKVRFSSSLEVINCSERVKGLEDHVRELENEALLAWRANATVGAVRSCLLPL